MKEDWLSSEMVIAKKFQCPAWWLICQIGVQRRGLIHEWGLFENGGLNRSFTEYIK